MKKILLKCGDNIKSTDNSSNDNIDYVDEEDSKNNENNSNLLKHNALKILQGFLTL